ncbi:LysR family transcriptional regulator [Ignatzschineria larvae DSM 13226]|uniref:LysR family transcriptional regulator n=1 Tax=Ignatzschineria larvae DSM 13226 TaxID=1111732 RepID=A0ABZ3C2G1_9GAMM|nr:LysR family transcriptional regulator [Ignatzschineria larvae]
MTLRLMKIFRSVAEHKSFSRASEELDITRPAVSQAITQLEEQLQVKLFNRTTRKVTLTTEGELYYHHVVDILERMEVMEEQLKMPFKGPAGRIRIEASAAIAKYFLLPHILSFQQHYPSIEILLGTNESNINFEESAIDFAIQLGSTNDQSIIVQPLAEIKFVCCAAPSYLESYGRPQSLADLDFHKAVNYFSTSTGRTFSWPFIDQKEIKQVHMKHDIAVNDVDTCLAYTVAGKGIAVLARYLAEPYIQEGRLETILEQYPIAQQPLNLLYLPNKLDNPKLKLFYEWLIKSAIEQDL